MNLSEEEARELERKLAEREPAVRECSRCGYHYKPIEMRVLERPTRYLCRDRVRCNRNIARREADREALK